MDGFISTFAVLVLGILIGVGICVFGLVVGFKWLVALSDVRLEMPVKRDPRLHPVCDSHNLLGIRM